MKCLSVLQSHCVAFLRHVYYPWWQGLSVHNMRKMFLKVFPQLILVDFRTYLFLKVRQVTQFLEGKFNSQCPIEGTWGPHMLWFLLPSSEEAALGLSSWGEVNKGLRKTPRVLTYQTPSTWKTWRVRIIPPPSELTFLVLIFSEFGRKILCVCFTCCLKKWSFCVCFW